ncbi:MAG: N-6 DNA methylase, partial [Candidatus Desantisbacteria bacterium]
MLDSQTKKRIDTARDILVGKIPDPKSQVEQITIALIYKFMDDMDKQSEEMGGKAKFFSGEYEKYAWSKIFDPRVSGNNLVVLYGEAIQGMNQNPNIPQLFRNIFKNAYLPYRDPETLRIFLKVIAEFEYDHSERLGDAFEYLLSVMGSQGDAGQFRTPRHIIDFMVKAVAPGKNETILDPACGTAGFLISAFNYIQNTNRDEGNGRINLTPGERARLVENFTGYDISPDMVRLSLVNMYLHGFQNPKIYEYDTLTSEDKWNEYFDVILANPPFMTPKGGIRPHKRFSVHANRSEVLFVDYIAEHLNVHGRAGVIVPEGIIFQSANAYKALRKMLVDNGYLYAVVSLPAGVFNPYSGVKTSILLMDKTLAKKTKNILFVKVANDGFDLGAQRRPIDKNDLPEALRILQSFCHSIRSGNPDWIPEQTEGEKLSLLVEKSKIAENGEYNLSWGRYQVSAVGVNQKWPMVELGEVVELNRGVVYSKKDEVSKDGFKVLRAN